MYQVSSFHMLCTVYKEVVLQRKSNIFTIKSNCIQMDMKKFEKAMKQVAFYLIIQNALSTYPLYLAQKWRGCPFSPAETPGWGKLVWDICLVIVIQEVAFYYSHRYDVCYVYPDV